MEPASAASVLKNLTPDFMAAYINNLTWWSVLTAVLFPIIWAIIYAIKNRAKLGSAEENSKMGFAMISKAAAAFSLPAAPALAFCAFYPDLLTQVQNLSLALVLAAFAILIIFIVDFFRF